MRNNPLIKHLTAVINKKPLIKHLTAKKTLTKYLTAVMDEVWVSISDRFFFEIQSNPV